MKTRSLVLAVALITVSACRNEGPRAEPSTAAPPAGSAAALAGACSAQQALDRMDTRGPVPLLPMMANHQKQMMRDHLVSVHGIVDGLARGDFGAVESAAKKSGYSEQMGMTCSHMGTGAPGFTEQAITFHKSADTIADAAQRKDRDGVVSALAATLATCVGCHATYKQQLVDERTWAQVSAGSPAGK
jgi:hypothetical protein